MKQLLAILFAISLFAPARAETKSVWPHLDKFKSVANHDSVKIRTPRLDAITTDPQIPYQPSRKAFLYESDCTVFVDYPQQALYDWMEGYEIYFAYQDLRFPLVDCDTLYPFVVTHIGMTLVLNYAGEFNIQVFLTEVDPIYSSPVCPIPGEFIYLGEEYPVEVPGPEVYSVIIALEQPVAVYGPYFACVFFNSDMLGFDPGLALDTIPYICINYNEWGYGLTDLVDNEYYNFPGSIHLFSIGYSKAGMLPNPRFIVPTDSGFTLPGKPLWVAEGNNQLQFQGALFEYFKSGAWYEIATDFDGTSTLRDGVSSAATGDGWSVVWQPFGLNEGNYLMRVSVADFDSTFASDTAVVYLDLKPLEPVFVNRNDLMSVCGAETLRVTIEDENPTAVNFGYRYLPNSEERSLQLLNRNTYGDANGNPNDGNHNYAGEFGEYYSAPTVLTSFFKHWFDKGYIELMADGATFLSTSQMVEALAFQFHTRDNLGTEDDDMVAGLLDYLKSHGDRIKGDARQRPDWDWVKYCYLGNLATVALAIDRPFGHWLAIQKIDYANATSDSFPVTYYDPVGGSLRQSFLVARGDSLVLGYLPNNTKYRVQLGVGLYPKQEAVTYTTFWTDFTVYDEFSGVLPTGIFQEDLLYLVRSRALDANNDLADAYWIMKHDCTQPVVRGDADHNNIITISDAVFIINFIFATGPAPFTSKNGDADCNSIITISDAVYIINFIFAAGPAPCP